MHRLIFAFFLLLSACAPRAVVDGGIYRTPTSPIYSNAAFDVARMEGNWDQVATFSMTSCGPGKAEFAGKGTALQARYKLCVSGLDLLGSGVVAPTGPGRFKVVGDDAIGQDWWVLWVDESYRTMAIGAPSGTFGFILNRGEKIPADRLKAAREVLDFNGYNTKKLRVFGQ